MNLLQPLYRIADRLRYRAEADLGRFGEDLAHRHLRAHGFIVVARNWRPPQGGGEIDLVCRDGDRLVFVEVKTRNSGQLSAPERDIDAEKIALLRRAARDYIRRSNSDPSSARFDAITITGGLIQHLKDAFPVHPDISRRGAPQGPG